ncbi:MAG: hypothetical protein NVSMB55_03370 [Mycobacteriales bacterium]
MTTRPRRRAVGPPGARLPQDEPRTEEPRAAEPGSQDVGVWPPDDDERLRAERPPHHDQER